LPSEEQFSAKIILYKESPVDVSEKKNPESEPSTSFKPLPDSSGRSLRDHSGSPSIVNLGRRSVVSKRLAEIRHYPALGVSTSPDACQSPTSLSSKAVTRERSTSNSVTAPELTDSGGPIERLPANAEQLTSPISSRASPLSLDDRLLTSPVSVATDQTLSSRPKSVFRLREELRARDVALLQRRSPSGRSSSSPEAASYVSVEGDGPIGALLDVMDVHAERQLIKTAALGDKLEAVQNDVQDVANNVHVAISGWEQDSRHLAEIHTAVDDVRLALAQLDAKQQDNIPTAMSIDERLRNNQAQIFQALEEIQAVLKSSTANSAVDGKGKADPITGEQLPAHMPDGHDSGSEHPDLTDIRQKLDLLVELSAPKPNSVSSNPPQDTQPGVSPVRPTMNATKIPECVLTIQDSAPRKHSGERGEQEAKSKTGPAAKRSESTMHNLKESTPGDSDAQMQNTDDEGTHAQLMEQQAESVRYLNELNTVRRTLACARYCST
jgi:hypothetical protein